MTDDPPDFQTLIGADDTATGGLAYDYDDDIHEANQAGRDPDDDWDEQLPPTKLWVHPDTTVDAGTLCDPDDFMDAANADGKVVFACPGSGCINKLRVHAALTYADIRGHDGLVRCPECDTPVFAHQMPPRDYHSPNAPGAVGGLFGGGRP